ncbi:MAG: hypothetical protein WD361_01150 [Gracilimonas sp.]
MTRQSLEKYQVLIYSAMILAGLLFGSLFSGVHSIFETLLWPILALLLYTTFTQISISKLRSAFSDLRFISTALTGNFILIPLIVWGMIQFLPEEPAMQLGVALVLLVPCTDWFITFTQLGGGDTERAIAFSPVSLMFQILLLPFYLFLFFGNALTVTLATNDMLFAFTGIILFPLFMAFLTEKWANNRADRQRLIFRIGWFPVPLLAVVIFMISASQSEIIFTATSFLWIPAAVFIAFLLVGLLLAKSLSAFMKLPAHHGRVLAFSFGSRNSFVVLPLALALPETFGLTVLVVVLQSLVELFGMALYVWFVPNVLFKTE